MIDPSKHQTAPPQNTSTVVILLLFTLSFSLRFFLISKGPYHVDCLGLAIAAENTLKTLHLNYEYGFGYPTDVILATFFVWLLRVFGFQDSVFAVNFMSVVISSLSIPLFYATIKKLLDRRTALLSALLLCFSPIYLGLSVYGKSHTPSLFFLILGIYFLINKAKKKYFFLSAIAVGFMGATRLQDMVVMAIPISYLLFSGEKDLKIFFKDLVLYWSIVFGVTALLHAPYVIGPDKEEYLSQLSAFTKDASSQWVSLFSPALFSCLNYFEMNSTWLGLILALLGFILLLTRKPKIFLFCFLWFMVTLLFFGNMWSTRPRYLNLTIPALCIAQGFFLAYFINLRKIFKITTLIALLIIIFIPFNSILPILWFRHQRALLPEYVQWLDRMVEKNAVFITSDEGLFINYYADHAILYKPVELYTPVAEGQFNDFKKQLDALLNQNTPLYITSKTIHAYDLSKKFKEFMLNNYKLEYVGRNYSDDWHKGELFFQAYPNYLFKITKGVTTD